MPSVRRGFSRQLFLGEVLDTEDVRAHYGAGVLTLRIPVLDQAEPRRIEIGASNTKALTSGSVPGIAPGSTSERHGSTGVPPGAVTVLQAVPSIRPRM